MAETAKTYDNEALNELIARAQQGDETAITELLIQYRPLIMSVVSHFETPDMNEADRDDFRQEMEIAFCLLFGKYNREQQEVSFGLYAKICLRNAAISFLRKHKNQIPVGSSDESEMEISTEDDPQGQLLLNEKMKVVEQTIETELSSYERTIWLLHYSGMSGQEIAKKVGKDSKSVQNALRRIKTKLKEALQKSGLVD